MGVLYLTPSTNLQKHKSVKLGQRSEVRTGRISVSVAVAVRSRVRFGRSRPDDASTAGNEVTEERSEARRVDRADSRLGLLHHGPRGRVRGRNDRNVRRISSIWYIDGSSNAHPGEEDVDDDPPISIFPYGAGATTTPTPDVLIRGLPYGALGQQPTLDTRAPTPTTTPPTPPAGRGGSCWGGTPTTTPHAKPFRTTPLRPHSWTSRPTFGHVDPSQSGLATASHPAGDPDGHSTGPVSFLSEIRYRPRPSLDSPR